MIPKIIHFCWLSGDEYPPLIKRCIESWKKKLPEYEFVLWDTNRFDVEKNIWVKQAFETKKYAFAADYIRLYAIYNYGGIYLDTDVEVLKSFNDLLDRPYFIGAEGGGIIEAAVLGAEKYNVWIKKCLDYYSGKSFIKPNEAFNKNTLPDTLPRVMMSQISKIRTFKEVFPKDVEAIKQLQDNENIYMFPKDFFCAKNHGTGMIEKTENTYCIHHFAMSWVPKKSLILSTIKKKLMRIIGAKFVNTIIKMSGLLKLRQKYYYKK